MSTLATLAVLVVRATLLYFAYEAYHAAVGQMPSLVGGDFTDNVVWLLIGGCIIGAGVCWRARRKISNV